MFEETEILLEHSNAYLEKEFFKRKNQCFNNTRDVQYYQTVHNNLCKAHSLKYILCKFSY